MSQLLFKLKSEIICEIEGEKIVLFIHKVEKKAGKYLVVIRLIPTYSDDC